MTAAITLNNQALLGACVYTTKDPKFNLKNSKLNFSYGNTAVIWIKNASSNCLLHLFAIALNLSSTYATHAQTLSAKQEIEIISEKIRQNDRDGKFEDNVGLSQKLIEDTQVLFSANSLEYATALNDAGYYHKKTGRMSTAEDYYINSLSLRRALLPPSHNAIAQSLNNLGALYDDLGRYVEAEKLLREAIIIEENYSGENSPFVAIRLSNLGLLLRKLGRHDQALGLLQRSLKIDRNSTPVDKKTIATRLNNLSLIYFDLNDRDRSLKYLEEAWQLEKSSRPAGHPMIGFRSLALGSAYRDIGDSARAEGLVNEALSIWTKHFGPNHPALISAWITQALLLEAQRDYQQAYQIWLKALELRRKHYPPGHLAIAEVLVGVARTAGKLGRFHRSLSYYNSASSMYLENPELKKCTFGFACPTIAMLRRNDAFYGYIHFAFHSRKGGNCSSSERQKKSFLFAQHAITSTTVSAIAEMAARQARQSIDLGAIIRRRQDLVATWRQNDNELMSLVTAKGAMPGHRERRGALLANQVQLQQQINELDRNIASAHPGYSELVNQEPVALEDIAGAGTTDHHGIIGDNEVLVFIANIKIDSNAEPIAWFVTRNAICWVGINTAKGELETLVRALRCGLSWEEWASVQGAARCGSLLSIRDKPPEDTPLPFDLGIAHDLYKAIFGEVEDLIKGKHLLIVPSGPLTSLPLQVLVTEKPQESRPNTYRGYGDVAWLGARQPIAVFPSVTSLQALRRGAKFSAAPKPYLGFGNPVLSGKCGCSVTARVEGCEPTKSSQPSEREPRCARGADVNGVFRNGAGHPSVIGAVRSLCPLPDTEMELKCVAKSLHVDEGELRLGVQATEAEIKSRTDLNQYRVLHFATHGLLAGDTELMARRNGEPALVMTPPFMPKDKGDDGLLTASEITQLHLDADWVILSACNTAAGERLGAEALSGLARAFFYAGARALLVSHWPVYSDAAVALTTHAIKAMNDSEKPVGRSEAMRQAMEALIKSGRHEANPHPSVWAPFTVVGDGASMEHAQ